MIQKQIDEFREKIKSVYNDNSVVTDGIIDLDAFNNSTSKILWILKEPYGAGAFDYSNYLKDFKFGESFPTSGNMWSKMIYTTYGILNDFELWNDIGDLKKYRDVFDARLSFALINLKKIPGFTESTDNEIISSYQEYKDLIHEQIEFINPDIIICGSTLKFLDFDINRTNPLCAGDLKGYIFQNRLFIDAYHPSFPGIKHENYGNEIITICSKYFSLLHV